MFSEDIEQATKSQLPQPPKQDLEPPVGVTNVKDRGTEFPLKYAVDLNTGFLLFQRTFEREQKKPRGARLSAQGVYASIYASPWKASTFYETRKDFYAVPERERYQAIAAGCTEGGLWSALKPKKPKRKTAA